MSGGYLCASIGLLAVLTGIPGLAEANTQGKSAAEGTIELTITTVPGAEYQLDVREVPLSQVLEHVASKAHVPIHYSVLPEGLVTATCAGPAVKRILECLLDRKADVIFRYVERSRAKNHHRVAEAWVLGSKLTAATVKNCAAPSMPNENVSAAQLDESEAELQMKNELLELAKSDNPENRADAIGQFLALGQENDPDIKAALEQALIDNDDNVRAQAVSTMAHREGSADNSVIQNALQDRSPEVRMMAVDSITGDVALLKQAANDTDESVRNLAVLKLQELLQSSQAK